MLKKIIFLLLVSVFSLSYAQKDILLVMNKQQTDWNNGDIDAFMQGYWKSEEMMFIGKNGPNYGWQKTLDNYKKSYPTKDKMGYLTFSDVEVKMLGRKYAHVFGKWKLERKEGDLGGIYTLVFQKFKDRWKIISDHTQ